MGEQIYRLLFLGFPVAKLVKLDVFDNIIQN